MSVRAVLVDLDDTLYPQAAFLDVAWRTVAERGAVLGLDRDRLLDALRADAAAGSARGGIIDRALERIGAPRPHPVAALLAAFRATDPVTLAPYPGAVAALAALRGRVPVALVSDGDVPGQLRKLAALGLAGSFDVVVLSDRAGRAHRKPHPRPFRDALGALGVEARHAVMIGDRPDKDVAGAIGAGLRAIRVGTGEYAARPDHPGTWWRSGTFAEAVYRVLPHLTDRAASADRVSR